MARKPNYSFERNQRTKTKADKRQAKRDAKANAAEKPQPALVVENTDDDSPSSSDPSTGGVGGPARGVS